MFKQIWIKLDRLIELDDDNIKLKFYKVNKRHNSIF